MQIIEQTLQQVTEGAGISVKNLHVTALMAANGDPPDYLTLDEALARGQVHVTEVSDAGTVPELTLKTSS